VKPYLANLSIDDSSRQSQVVEFINKLYVQSMQTYISRTAKRYRQPVTELMLVAQMSYLLGTWAIKILVGTNRY
jgi:hypothetical protein